MNRRRLPPRMIAAVVIVAAVALLGLLAAGLSRNPSPKREGPLAGSGVGGPFALIDQDGRAVTERTYAGKWRLMYFGYTYCPDVCPVDMQKIAQGLKTLDPAMRAKLVPIFVTVDPERDTPAVLKTFVRAFGPDIVGLTGTPEQVKAALSAWKVYARKAGEGRDYLVDHSAMIYLMDPDNRPVSFLAHDATPQAIAAEVTKYAA